MVRKHLAGIARQSEGDELGDAIKDVLHVRINMAVLLVIDDEFSVTEVLKAMLTDAGHEVVTAANGRQGLERVNERPPDLVLVDVMMPVMGGPALLMAMHEDPILHQIPTIIMSSLPESTVAESTKGMYSAFLRKPFNGKAAVDVVNATLNQRG